MLNLMNKLFILHHDAYRLISDKYTENISYDFMELFDNESKNISVDGKFIDYINQTKNMFCVEGGKTGTLHSWYHYEHSSCCPLKHGIPVTKILNDKNVMICGMTYYGKKGKSIFRQCIEYDGVLNKIINVNYTYKSFNFTSWLNSRNIPSVEEFIKNEDNQLIYMMEHSL